jgi:hypothetical protein
MSQRGDEGKRIWRERGDALGHEISDQITAEANERMEGWARAGRIPLWIRAKARLRGRPMA